MQNYPGIVGLTRIEAHVYSVFYSYNETCCFYSEIEQFLNPFDKFFLNILQPVQTRDIFASCCNYQQTRTFVHFFIQICFNTIVLKHAFTRNQVFNELVSIVR